RRAGGARLRDRDRPWPHRRPRPPHGPPRHQAAERPDRRRGPGEADRLRHLPPARKRRADRDRPRPRHDRLRRPRAGDGPRRRPALRHLLARRRALRDALRPRPVPGRQPGRGGDETRQRRAARRPGRAAGNLGGDGAGGRAGDEQGPGAPLRRHRRDDRRPLPRARGRGGAGSTTGEATSVLEAVPPAQRKLSSRARWPWGVVALALLIVACVVAIILIDSSGNPPVVGNHHNGTPPKTSSGSGTPVALESATAYDPEGDGEEEDELAKDAIDEDATGTSWTTEHYESEVFEGTKTGPDPGVGIYVTSKAASKPTKMVIRTPTPGWDAQIFAATAGPPEEIEGW